jgi:hypothetical protein
VIHHNQEGQTMPPPAEEITAMTLGEAADHCERAWAAYAARHGIRRDAGAFYFLKLQEELGELTRRFLELTGSEHPGRDPAGLRRKFEGDCASLVGNSLILAKRFGVALEPRIREKFPV